MIGWKLQGKQNLKKVKKIQRLDPKFALKKGNVFSGGLKTRAECRREIKIGSCWAKLFHHSHM